MTLFLAGMDRNLFLNLLNEIYPAIEYTEENPDMIKQDGKDVQTLSNRRI